jgi:deoxyribose-phosphate aldolase
LATRIDHTQLRPAATDTQIDQLCDEAKTYGFAAACVHPTHVSRVARRVEGSDVTPCTVVGFPHGVTAARETGEAVGTYVPVKVILETALLDAPEVAIACVIAKRAGADFVKTSTGFASRGARAQDVALMRQIVGSEFGVKASGGVGSVADAQRMLAHGATRIGASGSVAIIEEARAGE